MKIKYKITNIWPASKDSIGVGVDFECPVHAPPVYISKHHKCLLLQIFDLQQIIDYVEKYVSKEVTEHIIIDNTPKKLQAQPEEGIEKIKAIMIQNNLTGAKYEGEAEIDDEIKIMVQ